jgi:DNA mismatch repair ATPase MutS
VLFLFDELFSGTNSADRLLGAEAVVRTLLDAGAVGLVTTHDLALTGAAGRLGGRAANVHFADQVGPTGELAFRLRDAARGGAARERGRSDAGGRAGGVICSSVLRLQPGQYTAVRTGG